MSEANNLNTFIKYQVDPQNLSVKYEENDSIPGSTAGFLFPDIDESITNNLGEQGIPGISVIQEINDLTTFAMGEEGGSGSPKYTTMAIGEEGGGTTLAMGEEGGGTTLAIGEEGGGDFTTKATWEEGGQAEINFNTEQLLQTIKSADGETHIYTAQEGVIDGKVSLHELKTHLNNLKIKASIIKMTHEEFDKYQQKIKELTFVINNYEAFSKEGERQYIDDKDIASVREASKSDGQAEDFSGKDLNTLKNPPLQKPGPFDDFFKSLIKFIQNMFNFRIF